MLPKGWFYTTVAEACEIVSVGIVVNPSSYYVDPQDGVRAFRSGNVRENRIADLNWVYLSQEGHRKNKKSILRAGDVLIVRTGFAGTACVVTDEYDGANCIDILFARPRRAQLLPEYLCQLTNSELGRRQVFSGQSGLAQKHLNVSTYEKMRFGLPSVDEQKRIAEALATWDEAIATTERLLANSRQQLASLKHSLLISTEVRKGWRQSRIGELVREENRRVQWDDDASYPLVSIRRRSDGAVHRETLFGRQILTKKLKMVQVGDFVISKMQVVHGAMALIPQDLNGMFVSDSYLTYVSADEKTFDIRFLAWLSTTPEMRHLAYRCSYGVHIEKMTFDVDSFLSERVWVPESLDEQRRLCEILDKANEIPQALSKQVKKLQLEKSALLQQLLTGKRRVRQSHLTEVEPA